MCGGKEVDVQGSKDAQSRLVGYVLTEAVHNGIFMNGTGGGTCTRTERLPSTGGVPPDPKSGASTNSATPAAAVDQEGIEPSPSGSQVQIGPNMAGP